MSFAVKQGHQERVTSGCHGGAMQLEAQHSGRMELNMHIRGAVRRECPFLLFQYLCTIKLIQIIKYLKKRKAERFL